MSALTDQGYDVSFGATSTMKKVDSGTVVEMVRRGNAYFLPATVSKGMSEHVHGEVNAAMTSAASSVQRPTRREEFYKATWETPS